MIVECRVSLCLIAAATPQFEKMEMFMYFKLGMEMAGRAEF